MKLFQNNSVRLLKCQFYSDLYFSVSGDGYSAISGNALHRHNHLQCGKPS